MELYYQLTPKQHDYGQLTIPIIAFVFSVIPTEFVKPANLLRTPRIPKPYPPLSPFVKYFTKILPFSLKIVMCHLA